MAGVVVGVVDPRERPGGVGVALDRLQFPVSPSHGGTGMLRVPKNPEGLSGRQEYPRSAGTGPEESSPGGASSSTFLNTVRSPDTASPSPEISAIFKFPPVTARRGARSPAGGPAFPWGQGLPDRAPQRLPRLAVEDTAGYGLVAVPVGVITRGRHLQDLDELLGGDGDVLA